MPLGLRVVAGSLRGRRLGTPSWEGLRPTSDRLRETMFNILVSRVSGARVLDGYAGTGALGIEAISRGAAWVTFVESNRRAQALIAENLSRCGIEGGYAIIRATAASAFEMLLAGTAFVPFDVILLDPPYDRPPSEVLIEVDRLLRPGGLVMLEHARKHAAPCVAGRLERIRELRSGDSSLTIYTCRP